MKSKKKRNSDGNRKNENLDEQRLPFRAEQQPMDNSADCPSPEKPVVESFHGKKDLPGDPAVEESAPAFTPIDVRELLQEVLQYLEGGSTRSFWRRRTGQELHLYERVSQAISAYEEINRNYCMAVHRIRELEQGKITLDYLKQSQHDISLWFAKFEANNQQFVNEYISCLKLQEAETRRLITERFDEAALKDRVPPKDTAQDIWALKRDIAKQIAQVSDKCDETLRNLTVEDSPYDHLEEISRKIRAIEIKVDGIASCIEMAASERQLNQDKLEQIEQLEQENEEKADLLRKKEHALDNYQKQLSDQKQMLFEKQKAFLFEKEAFAKIQNELTEKEKALKNQEAEIRTKAEELLKNQSVENIEEIKDRVAFYEQLLKGIQSFQGLSDYEKFSQNLSKYRRAFNDMSTIMHYCEESQEKEYVSSLRDILLDIQDLAEAYVN